MTSTEPRSTAADADPGSFPADLSPQILVEIVERLAADEFTGRRIGTPGGRAAGAWLAAHLADIGATVTQDPIPEVAVRDLYATPTLQWSHGTVRGDLVHRRDFAEHLASADLPTAVSAPVAIAGGGDIAGRWVLASSYRADDARVAAARGAVGMLVPRGVDDAGWMSKMIAGPAPADIAVLSLRSDLHQSLVGAATRGGLMVRALVPLRAAQVSGGWSSPPSGTSSTTPDYR